MTRPSILFITTDEQHLDTVYRRDMPYQLPGLHGLMAQSDVYENAYSASPVCLPARCSWMNGLMPHRSGCISNNFGASLPLNDANLFTHLKAQGYTSSMHGKCHFVPCPYPAVRPYLTQEYEHYIHYYKSLGMDHLDLQDDKNISLWYYDDYAKDMEKAGLLKEYRRRFMRDRQAGELPEFPAAKEMHPDSWTGRKALSYLDSCDGRQPHFMWVSFSGPHYPMDAPSEYYERIDMSKDILRRFQPGEWDDETKHNRHGFWGTGQSTEGTGNAPGGAQKNYTEAYWQLWRKKYYANIVQIDDYIQQIIQKAERIFGDNLLIVFTADHGDMMGNHSLWGKNSAVYDDVLRIPLIVRQPGQRCRRDLSETVSSLDVFPTLLQYGGCQVPESVDGRPLKEVVHAGGRDVIISCCEGRVAIIKKGIKLVVNAMGFEMGKPTSIYHELYDLRIDPHEYANRYNDPAYAEHREELEMLLRDEPNLLRTVFYSLKDRPYWFNGGAGGGYERNGL